MKTVFFAGWTLFFLTLSCLGVEAAPCHDAVSVLGVDESDGQLTGRVVSQADGKPVAGAEVDVRSLATGGETKAVTDATGLFLVTGLRPGTYLLTVSARDFDPLKVHEMQTIVAHQTTTLRRPLQLRPEQAASVIRGAVFDARGFSMPGVKVVIERLSGADTTSRKKQDEYLTNSAGEFAFRLPGESAVYHVTASAKGFKTSVKEVDVQKNEVRNIAFTLEKVGDREK